MTVLLLSADQKQAIPAIQSLGKRNIPVTCLSPNKNAPAFFSKYCAERIHFPATSHREKYADFLKSLVKKRKYNLLIPCSDHSTVLVSEHRDDIFPFVKAFLPDHDLVKMVTSKSALMKFSETYQISAPKTYFPKHLYEVKKLASVMRYPMVVKGDCTAGAKKVKYAHSESDLIKKYREIRQIDNCAILQEYIDGREVLFYGLSKQGKVLAFFMMEAIRSYPTTGGTPAKAFSVFDTELKDFAFDVIEKTNWTGIFGLDIKQDRLSKKFYLLDFNPRFGATTFLAVKSGVDFPYLLYQLAVEGKEEHVHAYTKKIYRSLFREDMLYAVKKPLCIPKWLIEFLDPRVYYGFERNDPRPFFRMAKNTISELKDSIFK